MSNKTPNAKTEKTKSALRSTKGLRSIQLICILVVLVFCVAGAHWSQNHFKPETCSQQYRLDTPIKANGKTISVEVASDSAAKARGLSGRECIPKEVGMLFDFPQPGYYSFWMKDMNFPIDMVWINADHKVVTVHSNVKPSSYPKTFSSDQPAQYVLELKAGTAAELCLISGVAVSF